MTSLKGGSRKVLFFKGGQTIIENALLKPSSGRLLLIKQSLSFQSLFQVIIFYLSPSAFSWGICILNPDHPDSLGLDEIVRITENMNNNEVQNCLNKATCNGKTILLKIVWRTRYGLLSFLNHLTLSQSELIRVFLIIYDACEHCFCSLKAN